jgi:hypothetical protein
MYYLTKLVVCGARESRRLDVDCSTGRRPMERADEPPPPILLYQVGFGRRRLEWVGGEKKRPETRHAEARRGEVLWVMLTIV